MQIAGPLEISEAKVKEATAATVPQVIAIYA